MVAHACNSRTWEAEAGKITTNLRSTRQFPDRLGIHSKIVSENENRRPKSRGRKGVEFKLGNYGDYSSRLGE